jgi:hypothetical protein
MTADVVLMGLGFFVALLPFLGIPNRIDTILFCILGALVISVGIALRRASHRPKQSRDDASYGS